VLTQHRDQKRNNGDEHDDRKDAPDSKLPDASSPQFLREHTFPLGGPGGTEWVGLEP
jgi:hypothetical protein